jgi:hypothetical protein
MDPGSGPAAGGRAGDRRDGRLRAFLERGQHAVDAFLIGQRGLRRAEFGELGDVGTGGEGLLPGAGDDDGAQRTVLAGREGDLPQPLIHREGQRVARLRPVQRDEADAVADLVEQLVHGGLPWCHGHW